METSSPKVLNPEHLRNGTDSDPPKVFNKREDAQQKELGTFGKFEHLRDGSDSDPRSEGRLPEAGAITDDALGEVF